MICLSNTKKKLLLEVCVKKGVSQESGLIFFCTLSCIRIHKRNSLYEQAFLHTAMSSFGNSFIMFRIWSYITHLVIFLLGFRSQRIKYYSVKLVGTSLSSRLTECLLQTCILGLVTRRNFLTKYSLG